MCHAQQPEHPLQGHTTCCAGCHADLQLPGETHAFRADRALLMRPDAGFSLDIAKNLTRGALDHAFDDRTRLRFGQVLYHFLCVICYHVAMNDRTRFMPFILTQEQADALRRRADRNGRSLSSEIRTIVRQALDAPERVHFPNKKPKKARVNFTINEADAARLRDLVAKKGATTVSALLRHLVLTSLQDDDTTPEMSENVV